MTRNWTEEQRAYVFKRERGKCAVCGKNLVFKNRLPGQRGEWNMGHNKSVKDKGSDHLRNVFALCREHNLEQGTERLADYMDKFEPVRFRDKLKELFNDDDQTPIGKVYDFDMKGIRRKKKSSNLG